MITKPGLKGQAQLVMFKSTDQLLNKYYDLVRSQIVPKEGNEGFFFLTTNGAKYTQAYRKIADGIKRTGIEGIYLPTPSDYWIGIIII